VQVPLTMTQSGAVTVATGVLPIKRLAFKIGDGEWADTSMVADDVQVNFQVFPLRCAPNFDGTAVSFPLTF
jgi:hypothetical protein